MRRDMDTVRRIVLAVRNAAGPVASVEGMSEADFAFHAQLLEEAGLVAAAILGGQKRAADSAVIFRLTWTGHDFADSIVDDTVWKKAMDNVIKPSASWTFGVLLEYLRVEIRRKIPGLDELLNR